MYLISAKGYQKARVALLILKNPGQIWVSMKKIHNGLGVKNMSDLVLKEIYGIYKTKSLTNKQIQKYKMTERDIFEKYDNLSEDKFSEKSNKKIYVENDVISTVIKRCRGEKKEAKENLMDLEKIR